VDPDVVVTGIGPGTHKITFTGFDPNNLNFLNVSIDVFSPKTKPTDYGDAPNT